MVFPSSIEVSLDPAKAYIGNANNRLSFTIAPTSEAVDVMVRIVIPFEGTGTTFLVKGDDNPRGRYELNGGNAQEIVKKKVKGAWEWQPKQKMMTIAAGNKLVVTIGNLSARTVPGIAPVVVAVEVGGDAKKYEENRDVTVVALEDAEATIHYFDVEPNFVLHGGDEEVKLTWWTSPADAVVTLSKNNVEIWKKKAGEERAPALVDKPTITSNYRLTVRAPGVAMAVTQSTVQVAQPGWNQQALPQGYPNLLLAIDEPESETYQIFGVFISSEGKASLWSSPSGFADWEEIEEPFPAGMDYSPGVVYDGKLWLIGGSSVHPDKKTNVIWTYAPREQVWKQEKAAQFLPRMGHSCVVFQEKIWVMGGISKTKAMRDVWSYDKRDQSWKPHPDAPWERRCMFAALTTPAYGLIVKPRLWIYGGKPTPGEDATTSDIWWTEDGDTWTDATRSYELDPSPGKPAGATLFFDKSLMLAGSFIKERTLSSHVFKLNVVNGIWEDNPVSWGWEQFGGTPFLLQSIVYNQFYFFWAISAELGPSVPAPKLNIFIP